MKNIKLFVSIITFVVLFITATVPAFAIQPVIIGDVNGDLTIDVLDLVYAKNHSDQYLVAIDYDADGTNDATQLRCNILRRQNIDIKEYAVNVDYFDILEED